MILDGKIDLDVPVQKAWDFLIDINKFSTCLPGIDEVRQIDDKTFEGLISAAVGPISGKFNFRSTIVDANPPEQMVVKTEGTDSVTKSTVNADMTVDLKKISDAKSQMDYKADVKIKGRLGILGDMVLRATATLILQEFTKRLHKGLSEA
ncbi:MAG: hypothetical protein FJ145_14820 [Deltaproteobacteria bacterium]|nr:hypothetical protein [Deltaproteobacteria bacterium]